MDHEFHYYMTYLIAAKSGFNKKDAKTLAYSSQYIDNNDHIFNISPGTDNHYENYISQTKNITKPRKKLFRIYPIFHFVPGKVLSEKSRRKDGKLHYLNTTPDNENANQILDSALESNNLYKIGLAVHAFADTYAHQNFVGYFEGYNYLGGVLQRSPAKVGHASATHKPDIPNLIWKDERLCSFNCERNNKDIFLKAAGRIFEKLTRYNKPQISDQKLESEKEKLLSDLSSAIGETTEEYSFISNLLNKKSKKMRIENYRELSQQKEYGGIKLEKYDKYKWLDNGLDNPFKLALYKLQRRVPLLPVFIEAAKDRLEFIKNLKDKIMRKLNLSRFLGFRWK
ncbi:MAG: DUF6765 family protein, partial [Bacillota bacterium]